MLKGEQVLVLLDKQKKKMLAYHGTNREVIRNVIREKLARGKRVQLGEIEAEGREIDEPTQHHFLGNGDPVR